MASGEVSRPRSPVPPRVRQRSPPSNPSTGGDFVRQMRQLLDLLRQIAEVAPDPTTRDTARSAISRVDRGVVAASSGVSVV